MGTTGERIAKLRKDAGLSQAELGKQIGVDQKRISRIEAGAELTLAEGLRLAGVFELSPSELADATVQTPALSGVWYAAWQTSHDGIEHIEVHQVKGVHDGRILRMQGTRAHPGKEDCYNWMGEMRLWDSDILIGWYVASDGFVRYRGSLYLSLHPHGRAMMGGRVGLGYGGAVARGWTALTRDDRAERLVREMAGTDGYTQAWPKLGMES
ncbi:XRE family transcriptional regulator [Nocardia panacis]|uniref:XRE family transcriptional regulator n=1 Tax=Nocardia panacis TaxID=2340916 RepID=A0A3A4KAQ7_9NOCA|nr:helix-turn-helix transcriptional regulator [Nocardia panacis]RJO70681.1 XRE family transcriptional regulator [Nocardia panacis]